jgi:hypothetical protein
MCNDKIIFRLTKDHPSYIKALSAVQKIINIIRRRKELKKCTITSTIHQEEQHRKKEKNELCKFPVMFGNIKAEEKLLKTDITHFMPPGIMSRYIAA